MISAATAMTTFNVPLQLLGRMITPQHINSINAQIIPSMVAIAMREALKNITTTDNSTMQRVVNYATLIAPSLLVCIINYIFHTSLTKNLLYTALFAGSATFADKMTPIIHDALSETEPIPEKSETKPIPEKSNVTMDLKISDDPFSCETKHFLCSKNPIYLTKEDVQDSFNARFHGSLPNFKDLICTLSEKTSPFKNLFNTTINWGSLKEVPTDKTVTIFPMGCLCHLKLRDDQRLPREVMRSLLKNITVENGDCEKMEDRLQREIEPLKTSSSFWMFAPLVLYRAKDLKKKEVLLTTSSVPKAEYGKLCILTLFQILFVLHLLKKNEDRIVWDSEFQKKHLYIYTRTFSKESTHLVLKLIMEKPREIKQIKVLKKTTSEIKNLIEKGLFVMAGAKMTDA